MGLGEVFVGFGVGRRLRGQSAGSAFDDVVLVDRAEGGEGRGGELEDDDASAGLEYAVDFAQCLGVVGDVAADRRTWSLRRRFRRRRVGR